MNLCRALCASLKHRKTQYDFGQASGSRTDQFTMCRNPTKLRCKLMWFLSEPCARDRHPDQRPKWINALCVVISAKQLPLVKFPFVLRSWLVTSIRNHKVQLATYLSVNPIFAWIRAANRSSARRSDRVDSIHLERRFVVSLPLQPYI